MKYLICFSILFFVSFTALSQAKKNKPSLKKEMIVTTNSNLKKDYLSYVRTSADSLLAYGTDKLGKTSMIIKNKIR
ncbi:MAG: hypothetical protein ABIU11_07090 [Chitinophagaceae bacterium]